MLLLCVIYSIPDIHGCTHAHTLHLGFRIVFEVGCKKEIPAGQLPLLTSNYFKLFIDLSGHEADLVEFLVRIPPFWNSSLNCILSIDIKCCTGCFLLVKCLSVSTNAISFN